MAISWSALLGCATFWLLPRVCISQVAIDMVTDSGQVAQCVVNINLAILSLNECGIAIAEGVHSCGQYNVVDVEKKVDASLGVLRDAASSVKARIPKVRKEAASGSLKDELESRTSQQVQHAQQKVHEAVDRYHNAVMARYNNATEVGTEHYYMEHTCASNMINVFSTMTNAAAFLASAFEGCTQSTNRVANCVGQSSSIANALLGIASPSANMVSSCVKIRELPTLQSQEEKEQPQRPEEISAVAKAELSRNKIRSGYWCAVNVNIAASYLANAALGILGSKNACTGANVSALVCSAQIEAVFSSFGFVASYIAAAVTVCGNLQDTVEAQCAADLSAIVASVLELCNAAQMINRDDSCGGLERGLPRHDPVSWTKEWHENRTGERATSLAARSAPNATVFGRRLSVEGAQTEIAKPGRPGAELGRTAAAAAARRGELLV